MTQTTIRPDYIVPERWEPRLCVTSDVLQGMDCYVAFVAAASPVVQIELLGYLLMLLERAGVRVPEVWTCALEDMD
jgi:hypothetical protein